MNSVFFFQSMRQSKNIYEDGMKRAILFIKRQSENTYVCKKFYLLSNKEGC